MSTNFKSKKGAVKISIGGIEIMIWRSSSSTWSFEVLGVDKSGVVGDEDVRERGEDEVDSETEDPRDVKILCNL